jgi:hypothetical protein
MAEDNFRQFHLLNFVVLFFNWLMCFLNSLLAECFIGEYFEAGIG